MTQSRCPKCGYPLPSGAQVCSQCGAGNANFRPEPTSGGDVPRVIVTDFDMPFGSMVAFAVKWALACIPAAIILGTVWYLVLTILGAVAAGRT